MQPLLHALKHLYGRYVKAEISTRAAALAYHTLLGIVPIVGLAFWYLASVKLLDRWLELTKRWMLSQLNLDSGSEFLAQFEKLTSTVQGSSWGLVGLAFLAYTAWNLIYQFGESLDTILDTAKHQPARNINPFWLVVRRVLVMLGLPITITLSLGVTHWIQSDSWLKVLIDLETVGPFFALPIAWIVGIVSYFFIYYLIPKSPVPWKQALKVAAIVAPASEMVRYGFGVYNRYAVSTQKIYGVFAVIPMFVLWVQIMWLILLCGALFIGFRRPIEIPEA